MKTLSLGILGLSPGNGHPYSWAAICNGYDKKAMAGCPFPVIPQYLALQKFPAARLKGAVVTHIWTQDKKISRHIAAAALIENIVDEAADMIGEVDAVLLARDDGENHLKMARPFIEANVPILIDKPLSIREDDLRQFIKYYQAGKVIMSCSSMRYSPSILKLKKRKDLGKILAANCICAKYWRTYGIHLIEAVYAVMGGGIKAVQNIGKKEEEIVHMLYRDGRHAVVQTFAHVAAFNMSFYGEKGCESPRDPDSFLQFKSMLAHFVEYLRTGRPPFDWRETVEIAKVVIAGEKSLNEGGRIVRLDELSALPAGLYSCGRRHAADGNFKRKS